MKLISTSVLLLIIALLAGALAFFNLDEIKQVYQEQIVQASAEGTGEGHKSHAGEHGEHEKGSGEHAGGHHAEGEHAEGEHAEGEHHAKHKVIATSPVAKDVTITQQYVCQIHSRRHIDVCALDSGYLKEIKIKEGQEVSKGDSLFRILPTMYEAKLDADLAEARLAEVEFDNTKKLVEQDIVSEQELKMAQAKLANALAKVKLSQAEVNFADIKAPFDGIIDRFYEQEGSMIEEGAMLSTLSDNSVMWVYFNVPEARYLQYQEALTSGDEKDELIIELKLANQKMFESEGSIGAIEADFDNETGNIAFRADFANPKRLLRHGQTGTVLMKQIEKDAIVIPQRATFEILAKKYAYVIDKDNIVRQREIVIKNEQDDVYVLESGLKPTEKIVLEGIRQVRDGEKIEFEHQAPELVLKNLKHHAE